MPDLQTLPILSIIVPCYNEAQTIAESIRALIAMEQSQERFRLEIIAVDDCSQDETAEILERLQQEYGNLRLLRHAVNQGKGAGLRTGFAAATGQWIGIHDADKEYDPQDLIPLVALLAEGKADIAFGSRFLSKTYRDFPVLRNYLANRFLTWLTNRVTGLRLTDMETCYKLCGREWLEDIAIQESRFGVEPELTCKLAHKRINGRKAVFAELPIGYYPRSHAEGKKIRAKDGLRAIYCILKYGLCGE